MTCRELTEFLDAYLENELAAAERREFDRHLVVCRDCVTYLTTYRTAVRMGKLALGQPDAPLPEDVPEDLIDAILKSRPQ